MGKKAHFPLQDTVRLISGTFRLMPETLKAFEGFIERYNSLLRKEVTDKRKITASELTDLLIEAIHLIAQLLNDGESKRKAAERAYVVLNQELMPLVSRALNEDSQKIRHLAVELAKHRKGKQVSQANRQLYALIEQIDRERQELGEDSNFKQSAKRAVFQLYRTRIGWERHYRNFMDDKNKTVKRKHVKK